MKNLLVIKSSLFNGQGQSSRLVESYVERWQQANPNAQVKVRDLAADPVPHLDGDAFSAFVADGSGLSETQQQALSRSDALIDELEAADQVVIGLPMYNFSVPSTFKAWMDHVARAGVTFRYTESGPQGLLKDRPLTVITTRGGIYRDTENDTEVGLVKLFFGMLGISDVRVVYAEGLALGEASAEQALSEASDEITRLAA